MFPPNSLPLTSSGMARQCLAPTVPRVGVIYQITCFSSVRMTGLLYGDPGWEIFTKLDLPYEEEEYLCHKNAKSYGLVIFLLFLLFTLLLYSYLTP